MSGDAREEEQLALISQQIAEGTFRKGHLSGSDKSLNWPVYCRPPQLERFALLFGLPPL
jgi:hypothetical protein